MGIYTGLFYLQLNNYRYLPVSMKNSIVLLLCIFESTVSWLYTDKSPLETPLVRWYIKIHLDMM